MSSMGASVSSGFFSVGTGGGGVVSGSFVGAGVFQVGVVGGGDGGGVGSSDGASGTACGVFSAHTGAVAPGDADGSAARFLPQAVKSSRIAIAMDGAASGRGISRLRARPEALPLDSAAFEKAGETFIGAARPGFFRVFIISLPLEICMFGTVPPRHCGPVLSPRSRPGPRRCGPPAKCGRSFGRSGPMSQTRPA